MADESRNRVEGEDARRARPWDGLISAEEEAIYRRAGFFRTVDLGKRPVLLVIDAQYNYAGDRDEPVADAAARYRFACGERAFASLPYLERLMEMAREKSMPVVYTQDIETFPDASPDEAARGIDIIEPLAPEPGDMVVQKLGYSGFFATRLVPYLISINADTVIVCGGTTSGCVRASVVDAFDYRFRVFVPEECVFDRAEMPHRSNLLDMAGKAATVLPLDELEARLADREFSNAFRDTGDSPVWRHVTAE